MRGDGEEAGKGAYMVLSRAKIACRDRKKNNARGSDSGRVEWGRVRGGIIVGKCHWGGPKKQRKKPIHHHSKKETIKKSERKQQGKAYSYRPITKLRALI